MRKSNKETDDGTSSHIFSEITAALFFFMILFVFVQQIKIIEIFEKMKIRTLQDYLKEQIYSSFDDNNFNERKPNIIVDPNNPLVQRIIMTNNVLKFESGDISLNNNSDDKSILKLVGNVLKNNNTIFEEIMIEGHADTIPITGIKKVNFPTNWELSTGRATTVVRFLTDEISFPPQKLSAIGFSSYHPYSKDSIQLNRRIEMVIRYSYSPNTMKSSKANEIYLYMRESNE
jgi:flagellar motor protein MotB